MKTIYSNVLKSCAIALFSLSLVGNTYGDSATATVYENMITTALAKSAVSDKIDALNGIAAAIGSIDAETAAAINPEFTAALTSVYTAGQNDATVNAALYKLLTNALQSNVLSQEQQATVVQWQNNLKTVAPAAPAPTPSAQPQAIDSNAMQKLATASAGILNKIAALEQEDDTGKALEGVYNLLQEAQSQSFDSNVQEGFGRLVVKVFNDGSEVTAYLHQVLHEIVDSKTPLLAQAQIDYVHKEMLPRVDGGDATAHTEAHAAAKAADDAAPAAAKAAKKGKKALKKSGAKGGKTAKAGKTGKAGKKEKKDKKAGTHTEVAAPAAEAGHADAPHADKHAKKGKKTKKAGAPHADKHAKKGKHDKKAKHAAAPVEEAPEADNAPAVTE